MRWGLSACLILPAIVPFQVQAQATPLIKPGDRVRVTGPECHLDRKTGIVTSLTQGFLVVDIDGENWPCPTTALTRLEFSTGERDVLTPTLFGLGLGLLAGIAGASSTSEEPWHEENRGPLVMWGMATGTVGVVIGHVLGRKYGSERWKEVPLPRILPLAFLVGDGRFGIGLSIPFGE
jgi:hypothetical protein